MLSHPKKSRAIKFPFCIATSSPVNPRTNPVTFEDPICKMFAGISFSSKLISCRHFSSDSICRQISFSSTVVVNCRRFDDQMSKCPDESPDTILDETGSSLTTRTLTMKVKHITWNITTSLQCIRFFSSSMFAVDKNRLEFRMLQTLANLHFRNQF